MNLQFVIEAVARSGWGCGAAWPAKEGLVLAVAGSGAELVSTVEE
jgi:hypothetical protein